MANIKVNELNPAGTELFFDSESFLNDLIEGEKLTHILGGYPPTQTAPVCEPAPYNQFTELPNPHGCD